MRKKSHAKTALVVILVILIAVAALIGFYFVRDWYVHRQYPLQYEEIIVAAAEKYDLDPYFVCALIDTESGFDSRAQSDAGARGLMQIMPETEEWIAQKLGMDNVNIFDPETNIEMGCWYLRFLTDRFSEEQVVIAAYNAGHNRVQQWLDEGYSKDGKTLDEIPYEETEKYVKKVKKAYETYKKLYKIG